MKEDIKLVAVVLVVLAIAGGIIFLASSDTENGYPRNTRLRSLKENTSILNIDGCEYVASIYNGHPFVLHKGNCTNHIHSYNK
jgi:hypothetical protein